MSDIIKDLDSIEIDNTWSLVNLPYGKKEINVKWIYKVKLSPKVEVVRHKEILVAKGFLQREGIDFDEVIAPVAKIKTIRLVIVLANVNNWPMCQMDLKCEFFNGP